jgi:hypothetical protein
MTHMDMDYMCVIFSIICYTAHKKSTEQMLARSMLNQCSRHWHWTYWRCGAGWRFSLLPHSATHALYCMHAARPRRRLSLPSLSGPLRHGGPSSAQTGAAPARAGCTAHWPCGAVPSSHPLATLTHPLTHCITRLEQPQPPSAACYKCMAHGATTPYDRTAAYGLPPRCPA